MDLKCGKGLLYALLSPDRFKTPFMCMLRFRDVLSLTLVNREMHRLTTDRPFLSEVVFRSFPSNVPRGISNLSLGQTLVINEVLTSVVGYLLHGVPQSVVFLDRSSLNMLDDFIDTTKWNDTCTRGIFTTHPDGLWITRTHIMNASFEDTVVPGRSFTKGNHVSMTVRLSSRLWHPTLLPRRPKAMVVVFFEDKICFTLWHSQRLSQITTHGGLSTTPWKTGSCKRTDDRRAEMFYSPDEDPFILSRATLTASFQSYLARYVSRSDPDILVSFSEKRFGSAEDAPYPSGVRLKRDTVFWLIGKLVDGIDPAVPITISRKGQGVAMVFVRHGLLIRVVVETI